jgi:hypothetical protein
MKYRKLKFVRRSPYRPGDKVTLSPLRDDSGQVVAFTGVACVVDVLNDVASDIPLLQILIQLLGSVVVFLRYVIG